MPVQVLSGDFNYYFLQQSNVAIIFTPNRVWGKCFTKVN